MRGMTLHLIDSISQPSSLQPKNDSLNDQDKDRQSTDSYRHFSYANRPRIGVGFFSTIFLSVCGALCCLLGVALYDKRHFISASLVSLGLLIYGCGMLCLFPEWLPRSLWNLP